MKKWLLLLFAIPVVYLIYTMFGFAPIKFEDPNLDAQRGHTVQHATYGGCAEVRFWRAKTPDQLDRILIEFPAEGTYHVNIWNGPLSQRHTAALFDSDITIAKGMPRRLNLEFAKLDNPSFFIDTDHGSCGQFDASSPTPTP
jgi:hypothetical protein